MLETLRYEDVNTSEGLERRLILEDDTISLIYSTRSISEATIGWALHKKSTLKAMLEMWLNDILPAYKFFPRKQELVLEFWLSDHFNETALPPPVSTVDIFNYINSQHIGARDQLNLILLNANDIIFEISFIGEDPVQCVCTFKEVHLEQFTKFFRQFHADGRVRNSSEIAEKAFRINEFQGIEPLNALSPIHVIERE